MYKTLLGYTTTTINTYIINLQYTIIIVNVRMKKMYNTINKRKLRLRKLLLVFVFVYWGMDDVTNDRTSRFRAMLPTVPKECENIQYL